MQLAYGPPDAALARELRFVARAATALETTLRQLNSELPEGFPKPALLDLCAALAGLPDGTAEASRTELEFARSFLPKLRRGFFRETDEAAVGEADAPPPLERDGLLDQRLGALVNAVLTALDEYRAQAQAQVDDRIEPEVPLAADATTRDALSRRAGALADDAGGIARRLEEDGVSRIAAGDALRRRVKDSENLARATRAQLDAPTVDGVWLDRLRRALRATPALIKAAAEGVKTTVAMSRPYLKWLLTTKHGALDTLVDTIEGFCDATREAVEIWERRSERKRPPSGVAPKAEAHPSWAADAGRDDWGKWLDLECDGVRQRLRWIPPGRFRMGSPEHEKGNLPYEGPQHEVIIGEGFWLFATPVTQALYAAVMGENPSRFVGPDRPVEQVSWHDAQAFLERLNERVPGLDLVLPSEAKWEYACRAGTTKATYGGDLRDTGTGSDAVLDAIAWFKGNSDGETQPVALKKPNPWGLYDMLGNVFEWCADHWRGSYEGASADGSAWIDKDADAGASRVIRGGSWDDEARRCRAAFRAGVPPDDRLDFLGFRPARGQG